MLRFLDHLEEWLIGALMAAATLLIFVAVIHRYGMGIEALQPYLQHIHLSWAQELCIYMFVWMAKFGAAYGVRTGIHVGVDVLINRMQDNTRAKFIVFGLCAWENGAHYAFLKLFGLPPGDIPEGPTTPDLEWPTWIVYSAIPLGSSLMCFRFLQVALGFLRTGELPQHDHSHVDGMDDQPEDINWFAMDDNLHPHGVAHDKREGK